MANSILRYYKPIGVSNPRSPLSSKIPSRAIESANKEVEDILSKSKRKGPYRRYTPEERATIGKYAIDHGVNEAAHKYSINESTVRSFKNAYLEVRARKRKAGDEMNVSELLAKKQGRPLIVGEKINTAIQECVLAIREGNGTVNTAIVIAGARGILKTMDPTKLGEFGGPATLTRGWARSLLKRMKFTRRWVPLKQKSRQETTMS